MPDEQSVRSVRLSRPVQVLTPDIDRADDALRGLGASVDSILGAAATAMAGSVLRTVLGQLALEAAHVLECDGADVRVVLAVAADASQAGWTGPRTPTAEHDHAASVLAQQIVLGTMPTSVDDLPSHPGSLVMPVSSPVGAYVCATVPHLQGRPLVVIATASEPRELGERERSLLAHAAREAARVLGPALGVRERREEVRGRVRSLRPEVLRLACQPMVDVPTGRRVGVAVRARFTDGRPASEWFDEAAGHGLGVDLELAVVRRAAGLFERLRGTVSLALSAKTLLDPRTAPVLATLPVERLQIQLRDQDAVLAAEGPDRLAVALAPLRRRGASLAVDVCGLDLLGLRHVLALDPDLLVVGGELLRDIDRDRRRAALLAGIVAYAREAGVDVAAHEVQTPGEAAAVARLGVRRALGWHYGPPVPPAAVPGFVATTRAAIPMPAPLAV